MKQRFLIALTFLFASGLAIAADVRLLELLPADTKVVAGLDASRIKGSAFGQFLLSQVPENHPDFGKMIALTGFDPRRDLQEVVLATQGDPDRKSGLLVAKGAFDAARIMGLIRADGQAIESYKGVEIAAGRRHGSQTFAFLDNSLAIAGDIDSVRGAIDRRGQPASLDSALAGKVNQVSTSQDAWAASILPVSSLARRVPEPNVSGALQGDLLKAIESAAGGVTFGSDIQVIAEATTKSAPDATALADVVKFLASLVQLNAPKGLGPGIAAALQSMSIATESNTVKVSLSIPEAELEKLIQARRTPRRARR